MLNLDGPLISHINNSAPSLPIENKRMIDSRGARDEGGSMHTNTEENFCIKQTYNDYSQIVFKKKISGSERSSLQLYHDDTVGGTFPIKLQTVLKLIEQLGKQHIISWLPHGRSFMIHRPRKFQEEVMIRYFKQTKLSSFKRQLNLYDFQRVTHGVDSGSYYHEMFLRGEPLLATKMVRRKIKGKVRVSTSPHDEPNFYSMRFMGPIPVATSENPRRSDFLQSQQALLPHNNRIEVFESVSRLQGRQFPNRSNTTNGNNGGRHHSRVGVPGLSDFQGSSTTPTSPYCPLMPGFWDPTSSSKVSLLQNAPSEGQVSEMRKRQQITSHPYEQRHLQPHLHCPPLRQGNTHLYNDRSLHEHNLRSLQNAGLSSEYTNNTYYAQTLSLLERERSRGLPVTNSIPRNELFVGEEVRNNVSFNRESSFLTTLRNNVNI